MKLINRTTTKTEKSNSDNVLQTINFSAVPADLASMMELVKGDDNLTARLYLIAIQAVDQHAKTNLPEGSHSIKWTEALKRSGRRTQSGLNEAIAALIIRSSSMPVVAAVTIPTLIALQSKVNKEFKGRADDYYTAFYAIQAQVDEFDEA